MPYWRRRSARPRESSPLPFEILPGRFLQGMQRVQDRLGEERLRLPEHRPQIGEQANAQARLLLPAGRDQSNRRLARLLRPIPARRVRNGEQRLPDVGVAILDSGRHCRSRGVQDLALRGGPARQPAPQLMPFVDLVAAAIRLDGLSRCAPPHPDDNRSRHQRIGKPAQARERNGAVSGYLLGLDDLAAHDATASHRAAPMPGIQQPADLLVVLRLRPEYGVDLVIQDRRRDLPRLPPCGTGTPA